MEQKQSPAYKTQTSFEVNHLLGILARVTRRIVDEEQAKPKQQPRPTP